MATAAPALAQVSEDGEPHPEEATLAAKIGPDAQAIVSGVTNFGADLYQKIRTDPGDQAISPASISTAFGLAYAGAKGDTAREIATVLHYPALGDFHAAFGELLGTMKIDRIGRQLSVNNAIWLQEKLEVLPAYEQLVARNYDAGLKRVDYKSDPDAAREKINKWVSDRTNQRIRNLLGSPHVTVDTRSVLVNTIYFKADWASPFEKAETKEKDFTLRSGEKIKAPLMNQREYFRFVEHDDVKAISLPYRGFETQMVVLLPESAKEFDKFEAGLTAPNLATWLTRLDASPSYETILTLPKFKIEAKYNLIETLLDMGMRVPFSDKSDFSGMKRVDALSPNREDWNLKISAVVHQTFVEVEEKGTEAAAATAIVMEIIVSGSAPMPPPPPPKIFRADHPFVFLIRDARTKAILMMGRYTGESAE